MVWQVYTICFLIATAIYNPDKQAVQPQVDKKSRVNGGMQPPVLLS